MQKKKDFSLIGFLEAKVNAHHGTATIGDVKEWLDEAERLHKRYKESNAERRLRELAEEGRIEIVKIKGVAHYRKAPGATPPAPRASIPEIPDSSGQLFHLEDWGKAPEPDYSFTKTI